MKKVLIFTNRNLYVAPRVIREVEALKGSFELFTVGKAPLLDSSIPFWNIDNFLGGRLLLQATRLQHHFFYNAAFWHLFFATKIEQLIKKIKPDIIIIHDPKHLPIFSRLKKNRNFKLVFNAHEYSPLEYDSDPKWLATEGKLMHSIYKKWLPKIDLLINVCESIRQKCLEVFGVESVVVTNAAVFKKEITPSINNEKPIKIVHHGSAIRLRNVETTIEAVLRLGNKYQLDLYLDGNASYLNELKLKYQDAQNVVFNNHLSYDEIEVGTSTYDIGIFVLPPENFNYRVALPNKVYNYLQARLALIVSPNVEMKKMVEENGIGWVTSGWEINDLCKTLESITHEQIAEKKLKSDKIAAVENAEKYYEVLRNAIVQLG